MLFDASSIAQVQFDQDGRPVRLNTAMKSLLGIPDVNSVQGLNLFTSPRVPREVKHKLKAGTPARYELTYDFSAMRESEDYPTTRSDVRHVDYYALPLFDRTTGAINGYLAQLVDITERKRAETALKDAERLAAIGQTTTMIGHDLRNPLQAMQLIIDLGLKYFYDIAAEYKGRFDYAMVEQLFSRVEQQLRYMDKIVSDLQDYARPITPACEQANLSELINNTASALAIPESIKVKNSISPSLTVFVDPHLMQRALSNLIMNAVQAMPKGGELTIGATADDSAMLITIHDTGEGVPETMREALFSPLTTGKAKGTGLGLAVVKRIVEAHGGTITFESEEGEGTAFTVRLPPISA